MTKMKSIVVVFAVLMTFTFNTGLALRTATAGSCDVGYFQSLGLVDTEGWLVEFAKAELIPQGGGLPEHCRVEGTLWPETLFVIKLPTQWNERYYQIGGGGLGGTLAEMSMIPGLMQGYATAGNNQGHDASKEPGALFAYPSETNPNWQRKEDAYCYLADHQTNLLAKQIIKAYYGKGPVYSYWVGASNGGREGLKEAQWYPADFDGLVVGMPVLHISGETLQDVWNAKMALVGPGAIPVTKLGMLAEAVYAKCDSVDGLMDGIIDDPRNCSFNPEKDLPACPGDADNPNCFTSAQRANLKKIYDGPRTSAGVQIFPGTPPGGEALMRHVFGEIMSNWAYWVIGQPNLALSLGGSFCQYMATEPRFGPSWNWQTYDFDVDPFRIRPDLIAKCDATNPDLSAFKGRGGKILHWHGWADQLVTPYQTIDYYESVVTKMTKQGTKDFYRLYMVPGLTHVGSIGTSNVDWFAPLVNWVEKGIAPGVLIGSRTADPDLGLTARTRPICPYPEVARYTGVGSIDEAENFACAKIIPAKVQIYPDTLNLTKKQRFKATIRFPEGAHLGHGDISAVVCEGARAVWFHKSHQGLIAEFDTQDLVNIKGADAITFTVTVIAGRHGQKIAFEGSDTVKVVE